MINDLCHGLVSTSTSDSSLKLFLAAFERLPAVFSQQDQLSFLVSHGHQGESARTAVQRAGLLRSVVGLAHAGTPPGLVALRQGRCR